jgi:hypothetical protein
MALPFPPSLTLAILSCALVGPVVPQALSETVPAGSAPLTIGRAVYPLNGPWKFQKGDSPIDPAKNAPFWAEPEFDDSKWETVDLTPTPGIVNQITGEPGWKPGWTMLGHPGHVGWAWYRIQLRVTARPGERLALIPPRMIDDAYQVFADGKLFGSWGEFKNDGKAPVAYWPSEETYILPPGQNTDDHSSQVSTLTLAFRVWMGPEGLGGESGGMHSAPKLGDADAMLDLHRLHRSRDNLAILASPLQAAVQLLLAIVAASLLLFDRTDRVYIWLAALLFFCVVSTVAFLSCVYYSQLLGAYTFGVFWSIIYLPFHLGGWTMVWWHWFRFRRPSWVPWAALSLTVLYMLAEIPLNPSLLNSISSPDRTILLAAPIARLMFLALLVFIIGKAIRERGMEGWLVLPAVLLITPMHFQMELLKLHLPAFWTFFGIIVGPDNISSFLLCAVVALLLLRRLLLTVRREKQMALDIKQAQEVQQVILPERRTILPGMIVDCEFHPAREVGGDFFQVIPNPADGSLLIVAGDVTGKGLQAGMLVALLVGAIRTLAPSDPDPLSILAALNQRLYGRRQAHATCLALRIASNGEATLANAGHLPPYINGEPVEVEGTLPLGIVEHPEFSVANFFLAENDRLALVSDGVIEATNTQNQLFGFERLHELLKQGATAADIAAAAEKFGQQDDISVIAVSCVARPEPAPNLGQSSRERADFDVAPAQ